MADDFHDKFSALTDIQLIKAIKDINGYTEEAQPYLKQVAIERKIINEDK